MSLGDLVLSLSQSVTYRTDEDVLPTHFELFLQNFKREMRALSVLMIFSFLEWFKKIKDQKAFAQVFFGIMLLPLAMVLFPITFSLGALGMAINLISFPIRAIVAGIKGRSDVIVDLMKGYINEGARLIRQFCAIHSALVGEVELSTQISALMTNFRREMKTLESLFIPIIILPEIRYDSGLNNFLFYILIIPLTIVTFPIRFVFGLIGMVVNSVLFPVRAAVAGIQDSLNRNEEPVYGVVVGRPYVSSQLEGSYDPMYSAPVAPYAGPPSVERQGYRPVEEVVSGSGVRWGYSN